MDGEFSKGVMTVERAQKIGRFMARMHEFSLSWDMPGGFDRQSLHAWAFNPRRPMPFDQPTPLAFEEDRLLLIEEDRGARELLASLPRDAEWFGLIHSDLHLGNVLFEGDELNVIDFDDTGFGFWLYDFAAALCYAVDSDDYPEFRDAMLESYQEVRKLPPQTRELLPPFIRLRAAGIANWVLSRPDNPWFRENGAGFVHKLCDRIRVVRE
jgi:Ser/Thr protein kinase RdoA (MazF antagonist)